MVFDFLHAQDKSHGPNTHNTVELTLSILYRNPCVVQAKNQSEGLASAWFGSGFEFKESGNEPESPILGPLSGESISPHGLYR